MREWNCEVKKFFVFVHGKLYVCKGHFTPTISNVLPCTNEILPSFTTEALPDHDSPPVRVWLCGCCMDGCAFMFMLNPLLVTFFFKGALSHYKIKAILTNYNTDEYNNCSVCVSPRNVCKYPGEKNDWKCSRMLRNVSKRFELQIYWGYFC